MECPACHTKNKRIMDIIKSQKQSQHHHDQFHSQLEKAPGGIEDGFAVVADYFGRGLFKKKEDGTHSLPHHQLTTQHLSDRRSTTNQTSDSIIEQMKNINLNEQKYESSNINSSPSSTLIRHSTHHSPSRLYVSNKREKSPNPNNISETPVPKIQETSTNPFGDGFDDSPKKSSSKTTNPFGEDRGEDYDESLNPFN